MNHDTRETGRAFLTWGEPIVVDLLVDTYLRFLGDESHVAKPFAAQHMRVWRNLLLGNREQAAYFHKELLEGAAMFGLERDNLRTADDAVIDELMDVIFERFRRSPNVAKDYTRALIGAAATLIAVRQPA